MEEKEARNYVNSLNRFGSVLGLSVMKELMKRLGNPEQHQRIIQVAGTNGKGSVLAMLTSILMEHGYRVGRYISPAVFCYEEKFTINNKTIPMKEFSKLVERIKKACDEMVCDGYVHPTSFEFETALAYLYFKEAQCDITLIETGMGGDLDATNITETNLCSVIMSISLDHTAILGNTLEEIANHKSGIIKKDSTVIVYHQSDSVLHEIEKHAKSLNATMIVTNPKGLQEQNGCYSYVCKNGVFFDKLSLPLEGVFQKNNMLCALEVMAFLNEKGYPMNLDLVKRGLEKTSWPGRFEKILDNPLCYLDGAHNPDAAMQLDLAVKKCFTNKKIIGIIGILADKDYGMVLDLMVPNLSYIGTITPNNARGLDGAVLLNEIQKRTQAASVFHKSLEDAWNWARDIYKNEEDAVILAFGSLSWLGEFRRIIDSKEGREKDENRKESI